MKLLPYTVVGFIRDFGKYYIETEEIITQRLLESPFIHADETPINIWGGTQYVWVFTDGKHVIFKLTRSREATIVHKFLATQIWAKIEAICQNGDEPHNG